MCFIQKVVIYAILTTSLLSERVGLIKHSKWLKDQEKVLSLPGKTQNNVALNQVLSFLWPLNRNNRKKNHNKKKTPQHIHHYELCTGYYLSNKKTHKASLIEKIQFCSLCKKDTFTIVPTREPSHQSKCTIHPYFWNQISVPHGWNKSTGPTDVHFLYFS